MVITLEFRRHCDKNLDQETINKVNVVSVQFREFKLWIPKGIGWRKPKQGLINLIIQIKTTKLFGSQETKVKYWMMMWA